jgi:hypothetical protein
MQKMGTLKTNASLIYERANGITYAREFGSEPGTRVEVGWDYDSRTEDGRPLHDHLMDSKLWGEIRRAAQTNPSLQVALEHAILIYHLSKDKENGQE